MSQCKHGAVIWADCNLCKSERITELEAKVAELEEQLELTTSEALSAMSNQTLLEKENQRLLRIEKAAQAAVDAIRYQKPEYEKPAVDALAEALQGDDVKKPLD